MLLIFFTCAYSCLTFRWKYISQSITAPAGQGVHRTLSSSEMVWRTAQDVHNYRYSPIDSDEGNNFRMEMLFNNDRGREREANLENGHLQELEVDLGTIVNEEGMRNRMLIT